MTDSSLGAADATGRLKIDRALRKNGFVSGQRHACTTSHRNRLYAEAACPACGNHDWDGPKCKVCKADLRTQLAAKEAELVRLEAEYKATVARLMAAIDKAEIEKDAARDALEGERERIATCVAAMTLPEDWNANTLTEKYTEADLLLAQENIVKAIRALLPGQMGGER